MQILTWKTGLGKHHYTKQLVTVTKAVQMLLNEGDDSGAEDRDARNHSPMTIRRAKETGTHGGEVFSDLNDIPKTSHPSSHLDSAVIAVLLSDQSTATIEPYGQAGFSTPSKIVINVKGKVGTYFMKTGPDGEMFKGKLKFSQVL